MRNFLLICLCLLGGVAKGYGEKESVPYWQDVQKVAVHKEYPRFAFMTYPDEQTAQGMRYEESPYYLLLNGTWKFYFADSYRNLPANITDPQASTEGWHDIRVPGNWEVQGFGTAIYTNHGYEFQPRNPQPPALPEANPVGVYRREFEVPADWAGRDVFLNLDGAKAGVYVYLNGREVGYSEDSKTTAEFRVTPYLQEGKNVLTLKIFRWCTGSYLECQDFWRMSGIERDVYLWSQPLAALRDFRVVSTLDDSYRTGIFRLETELRNNDTQDEVLTLRYDLQDAHGKTVATEQKIIPVKAGKKASLEFSADIPQVAAWSAEHPNLYRLYIHVLRGEKTIEVIPCRVGFRRFEFATHDRKGANGQPYPLFLVNGQPIKFKGVNIHEHNPLTGHYVPEELMRKDLELMRRNNINSVRLCHYPQSRRFYELCDEYGIYVYDEANIESHGMYYDLRRGGTLGNNPEWLEAHMERTRNMYERSKNFPCVAIYSLGNEAGNGYNFYRTYLWVKEREQAGMNRPICYERAQWEWNSDMYVPQYPGAEWLEKIGKQGCDRPVIPSEYSHAMGNSSGKLREQWEAIYRYPHLQGGYIWDWVDQGLWIEEGVSQMTPTAGYGEDGAQGYWAYGGDFGVNTPSDGNFLCNGIVNPDRTPHPAMSEVKYVHQDIAFRALGNPEEQGVAVEVFNRHYFTDLSAYRITYTLLANGQPAKSGELTLRTAPQTADTLHLSLPLKNGDKTEYLLNLTAHTRREERGVPAGHVAAQEQIALTPPVRHTFAELRPAKGAAPEIRTEGERLIIANDRLQFIFDKRLGRVTSYRVDGTEYFPDGFGIQPNFWRAPTDNDYGNGMPSRLQVWKESSRNLRAVDATARTEGKHAVLAATYLLAAGNPYTLTYTLRADGAMHVQAHFASLTATEEATELSEATRTATFSPGATAARKTAAELNVPRIGVRFRLPQEMELVEYYGRGPEENYPDRCAGTPLGRYASTATAMYFPYVRPQENGHHTDTRWLSLRTAAGTGLLVRADSTMGFNALHNTVEDFDSEEATHRDYQWNNRTPEEVADHNPAKARNRKPRMTHLNDISPRPFVEVCLDLKQQGVAGYNSWGDRPTAPYTLPANRDYTWGFTLIPLAPDKK